MGIFSSFSNSQSEQIINLVTDINFELGQLLMTLDNESKTYESKKAYVSVVSQRLFQKQTQACDLLETLSQTQARNLKVQWLNGDYTNFANWNSMFSFVLVDVLTEFG